jgi:hypothetical protein
MYCQNCCLKWDEANIYCQHCGSGLSPTPPQILLTQANNGPENNRQTHFLDAPRDENLWVDILTLNGSGFSGQPQSLVRPYPEPTPPVHVTVVNHYHPPASPKSMPNEFEMLTFLAGFIVVVMGFAWVALLLQLIVILTFL